MSYSLFVYMLKLDDIRRIVGCRDPGLLHELISLDPEHGDKDSKKRDFDHNTQSTNGDDSGAHDYLSLSEPLEQLVMGTRQIAEQTHLYGYALERICQFAGEHLESVFFEGIGYGFLEDVYYVLPLVERGPPVPLPGIESLPRIGYLTCEECQQMTCDDLNHPDQGVRAGRNELFEWFEAGALESKDLVAFYY